MGMRQEGTVLVEAPAKERLQTRMAALRPRHLPPPAISIFAAALIVAAFFLPWMNGEGPFQLRAFSGFDFARLIRNFEVAVDTAPAGAQVRGTAVALYLVPAFAVNAAVLHLIAPVVAARERLIGWALLVSGAYALAMLALLLFMSLVPLTAFERTVGPPSSGFALSVVGGLLLTGIGWWELRRD